MRRAEEMMATKEKATEVRLLLIFGPLTAVNLLLALELAEQVSISAILLGVLVGNAFGAFLLTQARNPQTPATSPAAVDRAKTVLKKAIPAILLIWVLYALQVSDVLSFPATDGAGSSDSSMALVVIALLAMSTLLAFGAAAALLMAKWPEHEHSKAK